MFMTEEADRKLRTIPGISVWTLAKARQRAASDLDAVFAVSIACRDRDRSPDP
jgi:hypothetical protein